MPIPDSTMKRNTLLFPIILLFLLTTPLKAETPFFLLTIPKSGTHLIWKTMMMLTGREQEHPGKLYPQLGVFNFIEDIPHMDFDQNLFESYIINAWNSRKFGMAHMNFTSLFQGLCQHHPEYRPIIFVRDLRDVCISLVYFQWYEIEREMGPSTVQQKLLWVINKTTGPSSSRVLNVGKNAREAAIWSRRPDAIVLKYEDLVGPEGGGTKQAQLEALSKLANALNIPLDSTQLMYLADNIYGKRGISMPSTTFRQGKSGSWKTYFSSKHTKAFKKNLGHYQTTLGYSVE